jgi:hypothetical protein
LQSSTQCRWSCHLDLLRCRCALLALWGGRPRPGLEQGVSVIATVFVEQAIYLKDCLEEL